MGKQAQGSVLHPQPERARSSLGDSLGGAGRLTVFVRTAENLQRREIKSASARRGRLPTPPAQWTRGSRAAFPEEGRLAMRLSARAQVCVQNPRPTCHTHRWPHALHSHPWEAATHLTPPPGPLESLVFSREGGLNLNRGVCKRTSRPGDGTSQGTVGLVFLGWSVGRSSPQGALKEGWGGKGQPSPSSRS